MEYPEGSEGAVPIGSDFISKVNYWMWQQGYDVRHLFGFSAGGIVVAHHIIRLGQHWSSAILASAPVDWDTRESETPTWWDYGDLTQTAHFSDVANTHLLGILPAYDPLNTFSQMYAYWFRHGLYYRPLWVEKREWDSGHDVFGHTEAETGRSLEEVVLEFLSYEGPKEAAPEPPLPYYRHIVNYKIINLEEIPDLELQGSLFSYFADQIGATSIDWVNKIAMQEMWLIHGRHMVHTDWVVSGKINNHTVGFSRIVEVPPGSILHGDPVADSYEFDADRDSAASVEYVAEEVSPLLYPPWDVNQDGKCDMKDIALVSRHFGERYTEETLRVPGKVEEAPLPPIRATAFPLMRRISDRIDQIRKRRPRR